VRSQVEQLRNRLSPAADENQQAAAN